MVKSSKVCNPPHLAKSSILWGGGALTNQGSQVYATSGSGYTFNLKIHDRMSTSCFLSQNTQEQDESFSSFISHLEQL